MSRFAIAPQWLVYLPPTMSPVETSKRDGWLERPEEAFAFYRRAGVEKVVLEEKHMGSRAVVALCRDDDVGAAALRRPRPMRRARSGRERGRAFFSDRRMTEALLDRLRQAADAAGLWEELSTDWLLLDAEIMPWSAKASSLIEQQYAPVAVSGRAGLAAALDAARRAAARGAPVAELEAKLAVRAEKAARYARRGALCLAGHAARTIFVSRRSTCWPAKARCISTRIISGTWPSPNGWRRMARRALPARSDGRSTPLTPRAAPRASPGGKS